jgi:hypothetical protein
VRSRFRIGEEKGKLRDEFVDDSSVDAQRDSVIGLLDDIFVNYPVAVRSIKYLVVGDVRDTSLFMCYTTSVFSRQSIPTSSLTTNE